MKADISLAIFDFDGVVVNSQDDIIDAINYTLETYERAHKDGDSIKKLIGFGSRTLIKQVFNDVEDEELIDKIYNTYYEYYLDHCVNKTVLYDNVDAVFERLANQEIKIAIMTNKPEGLTKRILEKLGIVEKIDMIVGPESISALKPDPEGIQLILEELNIDPVEAIMIGDSFTDIIAGRAAETWTCGVTYGIGDTRRLLEAEPDFIIDNMIELLEYVESNEE